jgi:hypothetical protein
MHDKDAALVSFDLKIGCNKLDIVSVDGNHTVNNKSKFFSQDDGRAYFQLLSTGLDTSCGPHGVVGVIEF